MSVDNKNTFSPKRTSPAKPVPPACPPLAAFRLRGKAASATRDNAAEGACPEPAEGPARKPRRVPSEEARRSRKRLNALLHGITSNSPAIPGMEDEAAWQRHCDGIVASIEPVGGLEEFLAQRLASLLWRLNRVVRCEVAATMLSIEGTAEAVIASEMYLAGSNPAEGGIILPEPEIVEEQRELRILPSDHHLDRITKHERHFHRQALQTLHEIEALQARRKGHRVNLARVDFSGSPAT